MRYFIDEILCTVVGSQQARQIPTLPATVTKSVEYEKDLLVNGGMTMRKLKERDAAKRG